MKLEDLKTYALNHGVSFNITNKGYEMHNDNGSHKGTLKKKLASIKKEIDSLLPSE